MGQGEIFSYNEVDDNLRHEKVLELGSSAASKFFLAETLARITDRTLSENLVFQ